MDFKKIDLVYMHVFVKTPKSTLIYRIKVGYYTLMKAALHKNHHLYELLIS